MSGWRRPANSQPAAAPSYQTTRAMNGPWAPTLSHTTLSGASGSSITTRKPERERSVTTPGTLSEPTGSISPSRCAKWRDSRRGSSRRIWMTAFIA